MLLGVKRILVLHKSPYVTDIFCKKFGLNFTNVTAPFFCYQQFFIFFFHTTQHSIQNITKQNNRHILNISRSNQKGGREGRTCNCTLNVKTISIICEIFSYYNFVEWKRTGSKIGFSQKCHKRPWAYGQNPPLRPRKFPVVLLVLLPRDKSLKNPLNFYWWGFDI